MNNITQPELVNQLADLQKQIKALVNMHRPYYEAAEYWHRIADGQPEDCDNIELSLYSMFLLSRGISVLHAVEEIREALEGVEEDDDEEDDEDEE